MNNKILIIFIGISLFFIFKSINDIKETRNELRKNISEVIAINSLIRDKLDIKDQEIKDMQYKIQQYNLNYEAFHGTACQSCHLDSNNLLPIHSNKPLSLRQYVNIVRQGVGDVMPAYENRPNKGPRDITDSELRRQYNILKTLYEKDR